MTLNPNWYLNATGQFTPIGSGQINISTTTTTGFMTFLSNVLTTNTTFQTTGVYVTGPQVSQGTSGIWFATGTQTFLTGVSAATINFKLWDGTTVMAGATAASPGANFRCSVSVSGIVSSPAANIRIDGVMLTGAGATGLWIASDNNIGGSTTVSGLTAIRIG